MHGLAYLHRQSRALHGKRRGWFLGSIICVWLLLIEAFVMPKNYVAAAAGATDLQPPTNGMIDDFGGKNGMSRLGTPWRVVTDQVMGGVSQAGMQISEQAGRQALCLYGDVSLENNGGFVQANLDLAIRGPFDASHFEGVRLVALGNNEVYNVHLKTVDTTAPWQSYRASFHADDQWRTIDLPFTAFTPHRLSAALNPAALKKVGIVAIGRAFRAEVCIAALAFYRHSDGN